MKSRLIRQSLILLALASLPAIGQALYHRDRVSWEAPIAAADQVEIAQVQAWGQDALWVDARPQDQFEREHVPGALLLNEDRWDELLPQVLATWSPEKRIIVYCGSEGCGASREVARRLREELELKNVFVLKGGWGAWVNSQK